MSVEFPSPVPTVIQNIINRVSGNENELGALYRLLVEKDRFGSFIHTSEYSSVALISEGYKISTSTIRAYRRTVVNNPFNQEKQS